MSDQGVNHWAEPAKRAGRQRPFWWLKCCHQGIFMHQTLTTLNAAMIMVGQTKRRWRSWSAQASSSLSLGNVKCVCPSTADVKIALRLDATAA